jgi:hypothetical protein
LALGRRNGIDSMQGSLTAHVETSEKTAHL